MLFVLLFSQSSARTEEAPPYAAYFNPAKGFKPAQANFQLIFLQMAGSFESSGSPEAYLRHIMAENSRIDGKYRLATGKTGAARPSYFTDEYLERLLRNWNKMAPALALESLARESGRNMRLADWTHDDGKRCFPETAAKGLVHESRFPFLGGVLQNLLRQTH